MIFVSSKRIDLQPDMYSLSSLSQSMEQSNKVNVSLANCMLIGAHTAGQSLNRELASWRSVGKAAASRFIQLVPPSVRVIVDPATIVGGITYSIPKN